MSDEVSQRWENKVNQRSRDWKTDEDRIRSEEFNQVLRKVDEHIERGGKIFDVDKWWERDGIYEDWGDILCPCESIKKFDKCCRKER